MIVAGTILLWLLTLVVALYASEKLVHYLSLIGATLGISFGLLGFLVALGSDAPEVTSALVALARGSSDLGVGVVVGSNIYNLAGLLGASALVARRVPTTRYMLALDGGTNLLLTVCLAMIVVGPGLHIPLGVALVVVLALYLTALGVGEERVSGLLGLGTRGEETVADSVATQPDETPRGRALVFALVAVGGIVAASDALVVLTMSLGSDFGISKSMLGTFVLAIPTSLPNTWAAMTLARRGLARASLASTFNSNSINISLGVGLPSLFVALHVSGANPAFDPLWLLGMTVVAIAIIAPRVVLTRFEGGVIVALYIAFVAIRLSSLH